MRKLINLVLLSLAILVLSCSGNENRGTSASEDTLHTRHPTAWPSNLKVKRSEVDFSLLLRDSLDYRVLIFSKQSDSVQFVHMKYSSVVSDSLLLENEINTIKRLWNIASDSIDISLSSVNIGYPMEYKDVLKRQIEAFLSDKEWREFVNENGKKVNYELTRKIMLDHGVYDQISPLLQEKGYKVIGLSTEKHGFVSADQLKALGYEGNEVVPVPFIVYLTLQHKD